MESGPSALAEAATGYAVPSARTAAQPSPRPSSNRRPSDYESKRMSPAGTSLAGSGCSHRRGRLLSAFLTCGVTAGGMTEGMTSLATAGQPAVLPRPDGSRPQEPNRPSTAAASPSAFADDAVGRQEGPAVCRFPTRPTCSPLSGWPALIQSDSVTHRHGRLAKRLRLRTTLHSYTHAPQRL